MAFIRNGYVCRRTSGNGRGRLADDDTYRDWYLIKYAPNRYGNGLLTLSGGYIAFPREYIGKKVRLKIEIVEDEVWS